MARHSPCIGICRLDDTTGYCLGCGRTGVEIGDWISMSEAHRDAVWQKLPERLASLSVRVRLLPWTRDELVNWVRDTIAARLGVWIVGAPGVAMEFPSRANGEIDLTVEAGSVVASTPDVSFRLRINEKVRAFQFSDGGPIALGLPKGRAALPSFSGLQSLGPDADAIENDFGNEQLFDLGLGQPNARFYIRTADPALASVLSAHAGLPWSDVAVAAGGQLSTAKPLRIVESAAARIECSGSYPEAFPGGLNAGQEIAGTLTLPDYAASVAVFYPKAIPN